MSGKPLDKVIEDSIVKLFEDIAEDVGSGNIDVSNMTKDEIAGIPFALFMAGEYMRQAWVTYVWKMQAKNNELKQAKGNHEHKTE